MGSKSEKDASLSNFFEIKITDLDTESNPSGPRLHADSLQG